MSDVSDTDLHEVFAKDGVSLGELKIDIGSFTYWDLNASNASNTAKAVSLSGQYLLTSENLSTTDFTERFKNAMVSYGLPTAAASSRLDEWAAKGMFDSAGDEITQVAIPRVGMDSRVAPTIYIGAVTSANGGGSLGAVELRNVDMQGSHSWSWRH